MFWRTLECFKRRNLKETGPSRKLNCEMSVCELWREDLYKLVLCEAQTNVTHLGGGCEASLHSATEHTDGIFSRAFIWVNPIIPWFEASGVAAVDVLAGGGRLSLRAHGSGELTQLVEQVYLNTWTHDNHTSNFLCGHVTSRVSSPLLSNSGGTLTSARSSLLLE